MESHFNNIFRKEYVTIEMYCAYLPNWLFYPIITTTRHPINSNNSNEITESTTKYYTKFEIT